MSDVIVKIAATEQHRRNQGFKRIVFTPPKMWDKMASSSHEFSSFLGEFTNL